MGRIYFVGRPRWCSIYCLKCIFEYSILVNVRSWCTDHAVVDRTPAFAATYHSRILLHRVVRWQRQRIKNFGQPKQRRPKTNKPPAVCVACAWCVDPRRGAIERFVGCVLIIPQSGRVNENVHHVDETLFGLWYLRVAYVCERECLCGRWLYLWMWSDIA